MEFCLSCGSIIPDDAVYCPNCGAAGTKYRLEHEEEAPHDSDIAVVMPTPGQPEETPAKAGASAAQPESQAEERYAAAMLGSAQTRSDEQTSPPSAEPLGENRMAVTGFVFSVLPIPFIISGVIGLIVSSAAHKRAKKNLYKTNYETLAIAGKVLGIMRILFIALAVLLGVAVATVIAYLRKQGYEINLRNLWQ